MCDLCTAKGAEHPNDRGPLTTTPMPGTCGGLVVWGFYHVGPATKQAAAEQLNTIDEYAKRNGMTLLTATIKAGSVGVQVLANAGWAKTFEYKSRYAGYPGLEMWCKEIKL